VSLLVWIMIAIALWHFTVFLPDNFWGGIVGAFIAAVIGAVIVGVIANGFAIPGHNPAHIKQVLIAIPGSLIGLAASYAYGTAKGPVQA